MVFTKLLLENALAIRPCNCEAASEPLLPKIARCIPVLPSRCIGKCAARVLKRSAETEDFPAELGDGPDVVAETIKEIATLNIPSTQEFYALSPLNPGKKRKSSSKDASCPPKSREKEVSTISKSKSNSSRPSCRSRLRIKSPENSSILKSSQPKTISVTSTRLLASSNSQSEVMGLKKTVESCQLPLSTSCKILQVGSVWVWAWTKAYLQEIKVWDKLSFVIILSHFLRNRSSVRNASVCLVADDWDGSSGFDSDLQFESLLADQTPNADLGSDTDNVPENSASLLGADQGSELDNEALISLQEFYNFLGGLGRSSGPQAMSDCQYNAD